jgi:hypothetical protein
MHATQFINFEDFVLKLEYSLNIKNIVPKKCSLKPFLKLSAFSKII